MKFKRGNKVEWWSTGNPSLAVFVEYDADFPAQFCILAIKIGVKPDQMVHTFRWPLSQVANVGEGRTMLLRQRLKGV